MRKRKYRMEPEEEPVLDISSLIDVSFLLLIYFILTSTLKATETDLGLVLPTQVPNPNPDPIDPLAITVEVDGRVLVDGEEMGSATDNVNKGDPLTPLVRHLKDYKTIADNMDQTPVVIVNAKDQGKTQRFIDVVNALAKVKIKNVTMTGFTEDG